MGETELAWAAGFFDGEGSTSMRRRGGQWAEVFLQISQSGDTECIQRFHRAIGEPGKVKGPYQYRENMLPVYCISISGKKVDEVMTLLWPYLSGPKRAQYERCVGARRDYFAHRALHGRGRAKLTWVQVDDVRKRHAEALIGRQRVPQGWMIAEAGKLGIAIPTLAHIMMGRTYRKEVADG